MTPLFRPNPIPTPRLQNLIALQGLEGSSLRVHISSTQEA
jgi:hypothetical protein